MRYIYYAVREDTSFDGCSYDVATAASDSSSSVVEARTPGLYHICSTTNLHELNQ